MFTRFIKVNPINAIKNRLIIKKIDILDLPTKDVCGIANTKLSHAYIVTPNLLNIASKKTECECTLTTNNKNGQILLRRVDMKVILNSFSIHGLGLNDIN